MTVCDIGTFFGVHNIAANLDFLDSYLKHLDCVGEFGVSVDRLPKMLAAGRDAGVWEIEDLPGRLASLKMLVATKRFATESTNDPYAWIEERARQCYLESDQFEEDKERCFQRELAEKCAIIDAQFKRMKQLQVALDTTDSPHTPPRPNKKPRTLIESVLRKYENVRLE